MSAAVAALHVVVPLVGAPAYVYFGAGPQIAEAAKAGEWWPAALTIGIAVVFAVFSAYAFAGASFTRRVPLLRAGLVSIGLIYTLRGLSFVPQASLWLKDPEMVPGRHVAFSFVSLVAGLLYLAGAVARWRTLGKRAP
jgi:hypothetical protein